MSIRQLAFNVMNASCLMDIFILIQANAEND